MDLLLRWRARDIVSKARLDHHLPAKRLLLDLGAGLGHVSEAVRGGKRATDRRCVAMDPVWSPPPHLAARLQQGGPGWVQFLHADGAALPFAADSFDGAWCAFVLHHLRPSQQGQVLAEVARVLRPGGTFLLIEDTPVVDATLQADRRLNFDDDAAPHHYRDPAGWHWAGLPRDAETNVAAGLSFAILTRDPGDQATLARLGAAASSPQSAARLNASAC